MQNSKNKINRIIHDFIYKNDVRGALFLSANRGKPRDYVDDSEAFASLMDFSESDDTRPVPRLEVAVRRILSVWDWRIDRSARIELFLRSINKWEDPHFKKAIAHLSHTYDLIPRERNKDIKKENEQKAPPPKIPREPTKREKHLLDCHSFFIEFNI